MADYYFIKSRRISKDKSSTKFGLELKYISSINRIHHFEYTGNILFFYYCRFNLDQKVSIDLEGKDVLLGAIDISE
jgi:hypothetical protein